MIAVFAAEREFFHFSVKNTIAVPAENQGSKYVPYVKVRDNLTVQKPARSVKAKSVF